jgi:hypothetical protein
MNIILYPAHMHRRILDDTNCFYKHAKEGTLQKLRNGELSLVLLNSSEAMTSQEVDFTQWKKAHTDIGIPEDRIYFLSANLLSTTNDRIGYDYWQHDHSLVVRRREGLSNFQWELPDRPFHRVLPSKEREKEKVEIQLYTEKKEKPYLFLSMNRNCRPHRATLLSRLSQEALLSHANYSVLWDRKAFDQYPQESYKWDRVEFERYYRDVFLRHYQPKILDHEYDTLVGDSDRTYSYVDQYVSSYFSLVTETSASTVRHPVLWITEKTYKPLAIGHPFMVMGCPGTLAYLRSEGYATFPEWFDESYDEMPSEADRREAIVREVAKLSKLSKEELDRKVLQVKDKLEHNRNLLLFRDYKYLYERIFEKIK